LVVSKKLPTLHPNYFARFHCASRSDIARAAEAGRVILGGGEITILKWYTKLDLGTRLSLGAEIKEEFLRNNDNRLLLTNPRNIHL
jgi:hypothetical protein